MAAVLVIGAGMNGLAAGVLLARDPDEPDGDARQLWDHWERPGVNQFRQLHVMLGRWRGRMEQEIPEFFDEIERLGGRRRSPTEMLPPPWVTVHGRGTTSSGVCRGIRLPLPAVPHAGRAARAGCRTRSPTPRACRW
jgi:hypothetical protein